MDNLACGMYRIRNHNSVQKLRKPKSTENPKSRVQKPEHVRYMEMIPGSAEEEFSLKSEYICIYSFIMLLTITF